MTGQILQCSAPTVWGPRKSMQFQVAIPESCSGHAAKIANFRKQIAELEAELREVDRIASRFELASKSKLVAAIIMESSISFLDIAAAMFDKVNPAAAKTATIGISTIRTTRDVGALMNGQTSGAQFAVSVGKNALDAAGTHGRLQSTAAKVMLGKAKLQMSAIGLAVEQNSGASREDMSRAAFDFTRDAGRQTLETLANGTRDGGMTTTAGVLGVFVIFEGVYTAAMNYNRALEKHFDDRIDDRLWLANFRQGQTSILRNTISGIHEAMRRAADNLDACVKNNPVPAAPPR